MLLVAGVEARLLVAGARRGAGRRPLDLACSLPARARAHLPAAERDRLGAGYQARQSKIAVGSGELTGRGYMQGTQSQLRFLPARHTDFILAVLAEEWGFLGVAAVLGLYALYILNAAQVAMRARDRSGILLRWRSCR
jgi:cell division protein FtsW (lipid II flippase)